MTFVIMYYYLPKISHFLTHEDFNCLYCHELSCYINESLSTYLNHAKQGIEQYGNLWDITKKYTNPYEFIHTSYDYNKYVSKMKPISRAYYKMIEIMDEFHILNPYNNMNIKSFHLAEGPGGFIEAIANKRNNINDCYIGMSLVDSTKVEIPGWKRATKLLKKFPNIQIDNGITNDGDLYKFQNLKYCKEKYEHSMDIITADGGFDFSIDFNKQETYALKLIYSQIIFAITLQKKHGTFILKLFDCFLQPTCEMLYLLSCLYENVIIHKPNTSRYANSERYIICQQFRFESINFIREILYDTYKNIHKTDKYIKSIFTFELNKKYITRLIEINAVLGQQQLETIMKTFTIIEKGNKKNDSIDIYKKKNIINCIHWCSKHNIPVYAYKKTNIFK